MNIQQATEQIRGAISAYLAKDDHGLPCIPFHMQRPIIMFGPPGVGKTAIVSQIAREANINFVSYSITHHTRQSALGLPFIAEEEFDGHQYNISEYTMSEIIASVYRAQEETGVHQGILFLDEINCVSETLAPAMLQFLQYKTFGMHELPEGWIIVTAGNPPEYNRAAREFDPAMMDRLKRIDIEPDLEVWQEYAAAHGVHPAVTTFLESKPGCFYKVQASARGMSLVTARGWEDLSRMLQTYERIGLQADETLMHQYLQDDATAMEFAAYYELFRKYQDDYKVSDILDGRDASVPRSRVKAARFDERLALVGILTDTLQRRIHDAIELEQALFLVRSNLLDAKDALGVADAAAGARILRDAAQAAKDAPEVSVGASDAPFAGDAAVVKAEQVRCLEALANVVAGSRSMEDGESEADAGETGKPDSATASVTGNKEMSTPFEIAKTAYNARVKEQRALAERGTRSIDNAFSFLDDALGESSQESLVLTTKLSLDPLTIRFVGQYGSDQYMKHNKSLLLTDRGLDLLSEIQSLEGFGKLDDRQG